MVSDSSLQVAPPSSVRMRPPPLAHGPGGVGIDGVNAEEVDRFALLEVGLDVQGTSPVVGAQDRAELPDGPAVLRVGHRDRVEQLVGVGLALVPVLACVVRPVDRAVVAHRHHVVLVDDRDREEIVVDVDLPLGNAGAEVELVAAEAGDGDRQAGGEEVTGARLKHGDDSPENDVLAPTAMRLEAAEKRCCRLPPCSLSGQWFSNPSKRKRRGVESGASPRRGLARFSHHAS